ncbi:lipid-A-disaccharide synthase [bacterium]|nr:lipid-A-disaccharide synthase [bacterium]
MKKIFIITGEHSGDIHASNVVKYLKQFSSELLIEGIGGENMKNAGVKLFSDHSDMAAFGVSLKIICQHLTLEKRVSNYLLNVFKPDLVLLIDYGAFNLRVAKHLGKAGIKVVHFIPPQIWASRKWRIKKIKKYVDKVLCIFPFEENIYKEEGIDVHFCGHPLVSQLPPRADKEEFFKKHNLDLDKPLVSIFPGSRPIELAFLSKTLIKAAKELRRKHPNIQLCLSQAPNLKDNVYKKYIEDSGIKIIKGENHALLSVSDSLILASGTVALEAALYATPMVIGYKGPLILYLIYLLVRCIKNVSLPNIILNRDIVKELIQYNFTSDNICFETEKLLYEREYRDEIIKNLLDVREKLSHKSAAEEAATCILELIK